MKHVYYIHQNENNGAGVIAAFYCVYCKKNEFVEYLYWYGCMNDSLVLIRAVSFVVCYAF